jgi:uncharacterized protein YunC (DUF1805 family)
MQEIKLSKKTAKGFIIPLNGVTMVLAKTDVGVVGCGLLDIPVFERFKCPAAKVRSLKGPITDIESLLDATVIELNGSAKKLGIVEGMSGKKALEKL